MRSPSSWQTPSSTEKLLGELMKDEESKAYEATTKELKRNKMKEKQEQLRRRLESEAVEVEALKAGLSEVPSCLQSLYYSLEIQKNNDLQTNYR